MASTHKTPSLFLNKWLGTDKPKKDDFNMDNDRIDAAYGGLATRVSSSEGTLAAHAGDKTLHVTAAEKEQWGKGGGGGEVGAYTGTGASPRSVVLGFRPRFGYLFAVGKNAMDGDWSSQTFNVYSGFFSESGCSAHISLTDTGFQVNHQNGASPTGAASAKLNQSGTEYVYVVWR